MLVVVALGDILNFWVVFFFESGLTPSSPPQPTDFIQRKRRPGTESVRRNPAGAGATKWIKTKDLGSPTGDTQSMDCGSRL